MVAFARGADDRGPAPNGKLHSERAHAAGRGVNQQPITGAHPQNIERGVGSLPAYGQDSSLRPGHCGRFEHGLGSRHDGGLGVADAVHERDGLVADAESGDILPDCIDATPLSTDRTGLGWSYGGPSATTPARERPLQMPSNVGDCGSGWIGPVRASGAAS